MHSTLSRNKYTDPAKRGLALLGAVLTLSSSSTNSIKVESSPEKFPLPPIVQKTEKSHLTLGQLKPPSKIDIIFGGLSSAILLGGTYSVVRQVHEREKIAKNIAHPFSWTGWTLDSAVAVVTLASSQSWGLVAVRAAAVVANGAGLYFSLKEDSKEHKSTMFALIEFIRKKEERWNLACLAASLLATAIVATTKLSGSSLSGTKFHLIAALGLLGFVFTSIPSLRVLLTDLKTSLPCTLAVSKKEFCKKNFAAISWPIASLLSFPLAFAGESSWATYGWVILPMILNPGLLWKAWRGYVREAARTT